MDRAALLKLVVVGLLLGMLAGCGRMLPMGGRDDLVKYKVKAGDTLYSISWRYGYDHREVAAWNHIRPPYNIYPGETLLLIAPYQRDPLPPRQAATTPAHTAPVPSRPTATPQPARSTPAPVSRSTRVEKHAPSHHQQRIAWHWPSQGKIVAGFNPSNGKKGLDIGGKLGQDIFAAADGNVVYSGSGLIGYGNLIIIKHDETYLSAYGHNKRLLVKEGAKVKQGEKIAEMGDSGKDGVILHFEIRRDGKPVDPRTYLPKR